MRPWRISIILRVGMSNFYRIVRDELYSESEILRGVSIDGIAGAIIRETRRAFSIGSHDCRKLSVCLSN